LWNYLQPADADLTINNGAFNTSITQTTGRWNLLFTGATTSNNLFSVNATSNNAGDTGYAIYSNLSGTSSNIKPMQLRARNATVVDSTSTGAFTFSQAFTLSNLAGTGDRPVVAGSGGLLKTYSPAQVHVYHSVAQSIANATFLPVAFDSESYDPDVQHFTSNAALTGTVSKTASSPTVTGSGTSFTTELSVGQVFTIPGTATEYCVVTAISSNTSLTCSANLVNTASAQTGTRDSTAIVIRSPGYYSMAFTLAFASNGTGSRQGLIKLNNATFLNYSTSQPTGAGTDSFS
jgi:hypothetical protein